VIFSSWERKEKGEETHTNFAQLLHSLQNSDIMTEICEFGGDSS